MARMTPRKASLGGWWKGLPLLLLPFAVLFGEAWMRTQILADNYQAGELTSAVREIEDRLERMRDEESHLIRMSRMDQAAPELDLVEPIPGQIVVLTARAEDLAGFETLAAAEPLDPGRLARESGFE